MVNIALTNKNPRSQDRRVNINITTGISTFADGREIPLKQLLGELDFEHPLLKVQSTPTPDDVFHYEYDDLDGLFYAAIFVYSTLLHVDKPLDCQFKINPSQAFRPSQCAEDVYFSINSQQPAKESISISQLESLICHLSGFKFEYSNDIIIEDLFTIADLPDSIDGDALYSADPTKIALLKTMANDKRYELRYINFDIGFGVFSREAISTGDVISFYTGIKTIHIPTTFEYTFENKLDCLNMSLDARQHGNITRFVNHAPSRVDTDKMNPSRGPFLKANVKATCYYLNGMEFIVYQANKDILPGEQLLVDYGARYFQKGGMNRFNTRGRPIDTNKKNIRNNAQKKLILIRIMANHGVRKAQMYLFVRMMVIVAVILIIMGALNYL